MIHKFNLKQYDSIKSYDQALTNKIPRGKQRGIFLHAKIYFMAPKVGAFRRVMDNLTLASD